MDPSSDHLEFLGHIRHHAARLSRSTELTPDIVLRQADDIPRPPNPTNALLERAFEVEVTPLEQLLQALVLRRAIEGTEHESRWWGPLTYDGLQDFVWAAAS